MIKKNEIRDVERIEICPKDEIYCKNKEKQIFSITHDGVLLEDIYDFKLVENGIIYSHHEIGDLFLLDGNKNHVLYGNFFIDYFKELNQFYVVARINDDSPMNDAVIVDKNFKEISSFITFIVESNSLFLSTTMDSLFCFDLHQEKSWEINFKEIDAMLDEGFNTVDFYKFKNNIILQNYKGDYFYCIDILSGNLLWKKKLLGRINVFQNFLYSISNDILSEIDIETGEIIKQEDIYPLIESHNFHSTGEHKVYDDYIFCMSASKPGKVAVFERSTLKFRDFVQIEKSIPIGQKNLIWQNHKLYILDISGTLHIYEM
ncbi:MAG: hypothetical protein N4A49_03360 [Marinifilaceae bacterium]|jgi:outer membrane protein assembly factor BamB|nr:hypothetical protein [Marinifilaceae bacterium]